MIRSVVQWSLVCLVCAADSSAWDLGSIPKAASTSPKELTETIEVEIRDSQPAAGGRNDGQLLGDLGGVRPRLARYGMTFEINSYDEGFAVPDGGIDNQNGGHYHGLTDFVLSLDTEAIRWWRGGLFVVDLQNTRGGDISDLVGDAQGISNIVAPLGGGDRNRRRGFHCSRIRTG